MINVNENVNVVGVAKISEQDIQIEEQELEELQQQTEKEEDIEQYVE